MNDIKEVNICLGKQILSDNGKYEKKWNVGSY